MKIIVCRGKDLYFGIGMYLIIYCGSNIATDMAAAHPEAKTATFDRAL